MNITLIKWAAGVMLVGALSGCADKTPRLDAAYGEAVEMAKASQTLNPNASGNPDPVKGMGGVAADGVIDRYNSSYQQPPAPVNVFNIGIGSSAGGGK
jgi:hypothetical protein